MRKLHLFAMESQSEKRVILRALCPHHPYPVPVKIKHSSSGYLLAVCVLCVAMVLNKTCSGPQTCIIKRNEDYGVHTLLRRVHSWASNDDCIFDSTDSTDHSST